MKVYSIFTSIDGEINKFHQGALATFVRLAGCNLRCGYCDTKYAQEEKSGREMSVEDVIAEVLKRKVKKVTITGGEPLMQMIDVRELAHYLFFEYDIDVSIETNGSIVPKGFSDGINFVVDYKLGTSRMNRRMNDKVFENLREGDIIKYVVGSREDFEQAITHACYQILIIKKPVSFAFSAVAGKVKPKKLIGWMLKEPLPGMVFNAQLHKIIELDEPR